MDEDPARPGRTIGEDLELRISMLEAQLAVVLDELSKVLALLAEKSAE